MEQLASLVCAYSVCWPQDGEKDWSRKKDCCVEKRRAASMALGVCSSCAFPPFPLHSPIYLCPIAYSPTLCPFFPGVICDLFVLYSVSLLYDRPACFLVTSRDTFGMQ
jgi:hypothetical protein